MPIQSQALTDEILDTSKLGKRGEGWFLAQLVLFGVVLFPPHPLELAAKLLGLLALALGGAFTFGGQQTLGDSLTPFPVPKDDGELVTDGAYSYTRHPMYTGLILAAFGLAALSGDEARFAAASLLAVVLNLKATEEEKELVKKFPAYKQFQEDGPPKLLPSVAQLIRRQ